MPSREIHASRTNRSLRARTADRGNRTTVFVVDDDAGMRRSLRWLLSVEKFHVESFSSAREFLDGYSPSWPGCLILDMRMPEMGGIELQERLRKLGYRIPVIMITGHAEVPTAVRAMKAGVCEFIEKPFSDQVLLNSVRRAIEDDARLRAAGSMDEQFPARLALLTDRQRVVMEHVLCGKVNKEIAAALKVCVKTVEYHRREMMKKLDVSTLPELVRRATQFLGPKQ